MENNLISLVWLLFGIAAGASMAWSLARARAAAATEADRAGAGADLAVANARLDAERKARDQADQELAGLRREYSRLRDLLDAARAEETRLGERAARLPEIETELSKSAGMVLALKEEVASLRESNGRLESFLKAEQAQHAQARDELASEKTAHQRARESVAELTAELSGNAAVLEAERNQTAEKILLLTETREEMSNQFKVLAASILDEKARTFGEQSQASLTTLLAPLKEKIRDFQNKVEEVYVSESKERHSLKTEIERLAQLNTQISEDAVNLTRALKGDNKAQGIWGERVLETVLESSGLRKGHEYEVQASFSYDDGSRSQPDVIIRLPDNKHLIVDSKVSLTAYERYASADTDKVREIEIKGHIASLQAHVKKLSNKKYQDLHQLKSLDFVLMFVPVEPAFMLAVVHDSSLFNDAFARNVLLVSPSTLLATLRTIANIWRQEYQGRNAQEIASHCASLYDKFVGFVDDLEDIGKKLTATQKSYEDARSKLATGRGNLVRQAERVKALGVKPNRKLPAGLVESAMDSDEVMEDIALNGALIVDNSIVSTGSAS